MDDHHLRKNDNDYWLCPLCGHALIYDEDPRRLYCPKMVDVHEGVRWGHYDHQGPNCMGEMSYIAIIPPFYVCWNVTTHNMRLAKFGNYRDNWRDLEDIEDRTVSPEELLKFYQRLTKLKVFT